MITFCLPHEHAVASGQPERSGLRIETQHPASHYGLGVVLTDEGELLDGAGFEGLRDGLGVTIETDDPGRVCRALGLPVGSAGIVAIFGVPGQQPTRRWGSDGAKRMGVS